MVRATRSTARAGACSRRRIHRMSSSSPCTFITPHTSERLLDDVQLALLSARACGKCDQGWQGACRVTSQPLSVNVVTSAGPVPRLGARMANMKELPANGGVRSEEHTSELQSLRHLVCRL